AALASAGRGCGAVCTGEGATYGESSRTAHVMPPAARAATATRPTNQRLLDDRPAVLTSVCGRGSARADRAGVRHRVQAGHQDARPGVGGVHDQAVADVHADVADRAVVEDQVARLQGARGDVRSGSELRARGGPQ